MVSGTKPVVRNRAEMHQQECENVNDTGKYKSAHFCSSKDQEWKSGKNERRFKSAIEYRDDFLDHVREGKRYGMCLESQWCH